MLMKNEKQERLLYLFWGLVIGLLFGIFIGGL